MGLDTNFLESITEQTKEWKVNNQEAFEASTRSSIHFETRKFEPSIQEYLFQTLESITVGLNAYQIAITEIKKIIIKEKKLLHFYLERER